MTDHPLIVRRDAAQATLDHFMGRPFDWGDEGDCGRMVLWHLDQFPAHAPAVAAIRAKIGSYNTALAARRAISRMGVESLAEQLDALGFRRVPPAAAWIADIIAMPSEGPMDALAVNLGGGAIVAFHESSPTATVLRPLRTLAAWRVPV